MSNPLTMLTNIRTLLAEGMYPGMVAGAVIEAIEFVSGMIDKIERDANGEAGNTTGASGGTTSDTSRVVGSEIVSP